jgi:[protein-PII] uridylyltransferase
LVCAIKKPPKAPVIKVNLDNVQSDFFTIVEVFAPDRLGLLYFLAKALSSWPVDIQRAFISNRADLASDVFYVRTLEGEKLPEEELPELRLYLEKVLREICQTRDSKTQKQEVCYDTQGSDRVC